MVFTHLRHRPASGFTLIELLVVTAIIVLVTSVVLVNNNRFGGVVQLENLAYDVALSIRQAQVYGISVQRSGAGTFSAGYGIHFAIDDPGHYELFADLAGTGIFDPTFVPSENVPPSPYTITNGYSIAKLCVPAGANVDTCIDASPIDILFKRPEPDASIRANGDPRLNDSARIVLRSPRGDIMSVVVENNGQISVRRSAQ